jgi:hypothetical protein
MNLGEVMRRGAGLLLLAAGVASTGCNTNEDQGHHIVPAPGGATLSGFSDTLPKIDGAWHFADTVNVNRCGRIDALVEDTAAVKITQAHTELQIDSLSVCGKHIATAEGTLTPENLINASSNRTVVLTDTCSLIFEMTLTGVANDAGNQITGATTLRITPVDNPTVDCGPGYPCRIESSFIANRCPPADCTLPPCTSS